MKISLKQRSEIDFLSESYREPFEVTDNEIQEYLDVSVHGKGKASDYKDNRLLERKRG